MAMQIQDALTQEQKGTLKVSSDGRVHLSPSLVRLLRGIPGETLHFHIVDDEIIIRRDPL